MRRVGEITYHLTEEEFDDIRGYIHDLRHYYEFYIKKGKQMDEYGESEFADALEKLDELFGGN